MFIPNAQCRVTGMGERFDVHGQPVPGAARIARCSIVKLASTRIKTSVRTDSSASRGFAQEREIAARLLFGKDEAIAEGDLIEIREFKLKVTASSPRYTVNGTLDHNQIDAEAWS